MPHRTEVPSTYSSYKTQIHRQGATALSLGPVWSRQSSVAYCARSTTNCREDEAMTAETAETQATVQAEQLKVIDKRWSKPLTKAGWTALPNIVLDKQHVLRLRPIDINILMQIAKHWWQAEAAPFPSIETIAAAIGVTPARNETITPWPILWRAKRNWETK